MILNIVVIGVFILLFIAVVWQGRGFDFEYSVGEVSMAFSLPSNCNCKKRKTLR